VDFGGRRELGGVICGRAGHFGSRSWIFLEVLP
jgi:hypothetical protein